MPTSKSLVPVLVTGLVAGLAACGGGDEGEVYPDAGYDCEVEMRDDPFVANMTRTSTGGDMQVTIVDGDPAPPSKGNNVWTVKLVEGGQPLSGATIALDNYMPDHGHHGSIHPVVTETETPGTYTLDPVNYFMPGYWESTFSVVPAGGSTAETTLFKLCVAR